MHGMILHFIRRQLKAAKRPAAVIATEQFARRSMLTTLRRPKSCLRKGEKEEQGATEKAGVSSNVLRGPSREQNCARYG